MALWGNPGPPGYPWVKVIAPFLGGVFQSSQGPIQIGPGGTFWVPPEDVGTVIALGGWIWSQVASAAVTVRNVSRTTDYIITPEDTGTCFDNAGAAGTVNLTLPPWQRGLFYSFIVVAPFPLNVLGAIANGMFTAPTMMSSDQPYSAMTLGTSNAPGPWTTTSATGGWSES